MSDTRIWDGGLEPERFELRERPAYSFDVDRRAFLETVGAGVVVLMTVRPGAGATAAPIDDAADGARGAADPIASWLHVTEDGTVRAFTGKAEVGQDIRTSLTQVVAEELHVPVSSVELVMGDTDRVPFDRGTFGSRTTPAMAPILRRAAAGARELLVGAAAERWKVDADRIEVRDGTLVHPTTGEALPFGQLTEGERLLREIDADVATAAPSEWRVAGRSIPKVNGRALVTGQHRYASDVTRPGMLHGKVLRPPVHTAELSRIDLSGAEALDGVTAVRDGAFVGVAAPTPHAAARALAAVRAEWTRTPLPTDSDALFEFLPEHAREGRGRRGRRSGGTTGSIERGLADADVQREATYTVAYIQHAPLEPRAAVAEWSGEGRSAKLTVWTGTQRPFGVRGELCEAFRLPEQRVRVIVPDTGSGYGGKHTGEAALEAARLARAAGRPVKVQWTREEEFTRAYFRPAGVIRVRSGAKHDGSLTAWEFVNYNSGGSAIRPLYEIANQNVRYQPTEYPLRQGSYRALAATANHFARESMIDELANAVGLDPLAFRRKNLKHERLRAVLDAAAERFGWGGTEPGPSRGFGIACGSEKGSYVASCAEVVAGNDREATFEVVRIVTAFECGAVVNPDHLKSQVEGSVVMGLGGALFEAISFDRDRVLNPRFSGYRVPRFADVPQLETVLLDRRDLPSEGAGETPIVCVAPAIANALFAATGERRRALPLLG